MLTAVLVNCLGPSDTGRTDERIGTDTSRLANRTDAITITTSAGLAARRSSLINAIWGTSGLPTRSATPVGPPAGSSGYPAGANCAVIAPPSTYHPAGNTLTGMSHVQELTISMPPDANYPNDNNDGLACHFIASRPNGKLVVYNPGHGNWVNDGSDWTSDGTLPIDVNANYNYQLGDQRFIQQMLNDGYGVLLTWMPRYRPGDPGGQAQTSHAGMIQNYSASPVAHAWSYFRVSSRFSGKRDRLDRVVGGRRRASMPIW